MGQWHDIQIYLNLDKNEKDRDPSKDLSRGCFIHLMEMRWWASLPCASLHLLSKRSGVENHWAAKNIVFLWNLGEAGCFVAVVFWELFNCLNHRKWYGHILLQTWGSLWKIQNRFTTGNHWISLLRGKPKNPQVFVRPGTPATRGVRNAGRGGFLAHLFPLPKTNSSHLSGGRNLKPETHLSIPWWKSVANLLISFQGGFTHRPTGYQSSMNIRKQDNLSTFFSDDGCSLRRVRWVFSMFGQTKMVLLAQVSMIESRKKIRNTARYLGFVGTYTALFRRV